jgi:phenylalanyl-tRNA synthetase alpha chain
MSDQVIPKLQQIRGEALAAIADASTSAALYEVKVRYTGKNGELSAVMKSLGGLSPEARKEVGQAVNIVKAAFEEAYATRESELKRKELEQKLQSEFWDLTLPGPNLPLGASHPIYAVAEEMCTILSRMGFSVRTGPMIEKKRYNFEALNIPEDHPALDMQDTFYVDDEHVLRTHTSPIQIRTLESEKPPIRVLGFGSVFRVDSDVSHSPNFHQIEGLVVDQKVSMADLKGTLTYFAREFFGEGLKTRFRPSFFPFTEPSAEVDFQCPVCMGSGCKLCKNSGWIEIGGAGLVNPNVFHMAGVEYPRWQGYAFGMGVERMAIIKYGIPDIRLFNENDLRFLEQFKP